MESNQISRQEQQLNSANRIFGEDQPNSFYEHATSLVNDGTWDAERGYRYISEARAALTARIKEVQGVVISDTSFLRNCLSDATDARKRFAADHGHFITPFS